MKTRSNMPLYVVECDNVKTLSNSQIDLLRCGDYLVKKDASGEHAYKVTFKSDTGMCITYHDAYCVETQSYDKVDGNWVYNSEDKTIIAEPSLENIVDADGHKRFIEGNGTPLAQEGFTPSYNKWSLSGSHLMVVLAGGISNGTNISIYSNLLTIVLPQWIYDKIYTVWGSSYIAVAKIELRANDWSTQELPVNIFKSDNMIGIQTIEGITLTSDRYFRIQFDLLIDNE